MKKIICLFLAFCLSVCFTASVFSATISDLPGEYDVNSNENNYGLVCDSYPFLTSPKVTGDFIQMWYCGAWSIFDWQEYFDKLSEAEIDTVVIQYTATISDGKFKSIGFEPNDEINSLLALDCEKYPNMLLTALTAAKVKGIKVMVGLSTNEAWWNTSNTQNDSWIQQEAELVNKMAKCIYEDYYESFSDVFVGWYWAYEMWTCNSGTDSHLETKWADFLNLTLDYLSELTPDLPVMICPYLSKYYGFENADKCWREFFSKAHFKDGDIVAPQDCLTTSGFDLESVEKHISAINDARHYSNADIKFWLDVENYESGSVENFVKQLRICAKYATKLLCFSYVHYYLKPESIANHTEYKAYIANLPTFEDGDSETEIDTETETEPETETEIEIDTETESDTGTETETEPETESDTQTDTNINSDSDTNTETDTEEDGYLKGDINGDGVVDVIDVALSRAHIVGNTTLDKDALKRGDMNDDGVLDIIDVVMIRKVIVEKK